MDYFILIWSVAVYVEGRVRGEISLADIQRQTGFSIAHIRDVFARRTGVSLSKYIRARKMANAAADLINEQTDILEIALRYGFSGRDAFSRAFARMTGYTPSEFRAARPKMNHALLAAGVYGYALPKKERNK